MSSENPFSADNQQETGLSEIDPLWVVGFVDGEGCFSVSIHRNELARPTGGWQVQPTFQVSQHQDHAHVLHDLAKFFGTGKVRTKGARSTVMVYTVHSTLEIERRIIPFFLEHHLRVKRDDFEMFRRIVYATRRRLHHDPDVFEEIVRLAYSMNANGKQRKRTIDQIIPGSSETARQAPHGSR